MIERQLRKRQMLFGAVLRLLGVAETSYTELKTEDNFNEYNYNSLVLMAKKSIERC